MKQISAGHERKKGVNENRLIILSQFSFQFSFVQIIIIETKERFK